MISDEGAIQVRLTVVDPGRVGGRADVLLTVPPGTALVDVRTALLSAVGRGGADDQGADDQAVRLYLDGEPAETAVLGRPPLLHGATVTLGRPGGPPGRAGGTAGALVEVHVVAGPDAGQRWPLPPGATRVGRSPEVGLRVIDPDVSRVHAELVRRRERVSVQDAGSTNGTLLAGLRVDGTPREWPLRTPLRLGGSVLALRSPDGSADGGGGPAATHPDGAGRLLVNPAPRLRPDLAQVQVQFPTPPGDPPGTRLPWIAALLPLVLSVPVAWWMRQPSFLAFAVLSPLMMLGQYVSDRHGRRAELSRAWAAHRADTDRAEASLDLALRSDRDRSLADLPDLAAVAAAAGGPLDRLWERRAGDPDVLLLRLGLGDRPSSVKVHGGPDRAEPPALTEVPIPLDLVAVGVAGLAGPRPEVLGLARALVAQAAVWHSPRDLRIVVLRAAPEGSPAADWAWTAWLPHADASLPAPPRPGAAGLPTADRAGTQVDARYRSPRVLLVLDGAERLRRDPRVAGLLARGPAAGVQALCLEADPARLPAECGATVLLDAGAPGRLTVRGEPAREFAADLAGPGWAERLGRDLARLADATPAGTDAGLPGDVRLLDLLRSTGPDPTDPATIAAGWAAARANRERATTAVVGITPSGPWHIDLHRDGPHALIGGTTGAGKSELLTSLVAGLAARHPPDRLSLLLIDYKGGSAFGPLADLPHTAGMITDLDRHLARRALSSLRAEIGRREALLRAVGAADLDRYDRQRPEQVPALARLLIVVDEFRVLAEELPDLLTGLVRVAAVGRSLGIHLVLATQRPTGAVSGEIRANVNLRIALRMRDRGDSEDVVEAPDAAELAADRPGRGVVRTGGGALIPFQAARVTGTRRTAMIGARVVRVHPDPQMPTRWVPVPPLAGRWACDLDADAAVSGDPPGHSSDRAGPDDLIDPDGPDDLARLVSGCRAAAARLGLPAARAPWLPPLPDLVDRRRLARMLAPATATATATANAAPPTEPDADGGLVLGVLDLPEQQSRGPLLWNPARHGHLAVIGAPGSGRTSTLLAIAVAAGQAWARDGTGPHVHVIDGSGHPDDLGDPGDPVHGRIRAGLQALDGLPGIGTVLPARDWERADRLLTRLAAADQGFDSSRPTIVLVDGWEQVLDAWYPIDHGRLVDDLLRLARDGTQARLRLAVAGGRAVLSGPIAGLLTERLLLRSADPTDLVLAGAHAADVPEVMPPGRALRLLSGGRAVEAQVVLDVRFPDQTDLAAGSAAPAAALTPGPLRLRPLPRRLTLNDLLEQVDRCPGGLSGLLDGDVLPVGLGGDQAAPIGPPAAGLGWLVAGAPGSGRSATLATAGRILVAAGRSVVAVAPADSPISAMAGPDAVTLLPGLAIRAPARVLAALDRDPLAVLILDDVGLAEGALESELLARLDGVGEGLSDESRDGPGPSDGDRWPAGPGPFLLAGALPGQVAIAFRGLAARLRQTRSGILTGPVGPGDGEAFGLRIPARPAGPAGRALLVRAGTAQSIQLADLTQQQT